jgi:hypothetical protein
MIMIGSEGIVIYHLSLGSSKRIRLLADRQASHSLGTVDSDGVVTRVGEVQKSVMTKFKVGPWLIVGGFGGR